MFSSYVSLPEDDPCDHNANSEDLRWLSVSCSPWCRDSCPAAATSGTENPAAEEQAGHDGLELWDILPLIGGRCVHICSTFESWWTPVKWLVWLRLRWLGTINQLICWKSTWLWIKIIETQEIMRNDKTLCAFGGHVYLSTLRPDDCSFGFPFCCL